MRHTELELKESKSGVILKHRRKKEKIINSQFGYLTLRFFFYADAFSYNLEFQIPLNNLVIS